MKRLRYLLLFIAVLLGLPLLVAWIASLFHRPGYDNAKVHPSALAMSDRDHSIHGKFVSDGGSVVIVALGDDGTQQSITLPSPMGRPELHGRMFAGWYDEGVEIDTHKYPHTRAYLYCLLEDCGSRDFGIGMAQARVFQESFPSQMKLSLRRLFRYYRDESEY